ncbi:MAG: glycosyl hydrolase family 28-related protein [Paludibacter sp.]
MKKINRWGFLISKTIVITGMLLSGINSYASISNNLQDYKTVVNADSLPIGLVDITLAPFNADSTGLTDCTAAIQAAVNYARDNHKVCFFPIGTYLISETISCEQPVYKLPIPGGQTGPNTDSCGKYMSTDGKTQHYWNDTNDIIYLLGSTKGGARPIIKLAPNATGFGDAASPKVALKIWAQTRDDRGGTVDLVNPCLVSTPIWGQEQPNITFNHTFKGIDIDLSGNQGAIGLRFTGSQGCYMMDSKIIADGAFAGLSNCCGQGGGTYNIEVQGGQYGIQLDVDARFPMLGSCIFKGQTVACVQTSEVAGGYVPLVMVGCLLESNSTQAVDLINANGYPGINMIDCVVNLHQTGVLVRTKSSIENVFLENLTVNNITKVQTNDNLPISTSGWTSISLYSNAKSNTRSLIDGVTSTSSVFKYVQSTLPNYTSIHDKHWVTLPSFEDNDAVNVKDFGAMGDGSTNDIAAFNAAMAISNKVFVPNGNYILGETLVLGANTQLFGLDKFTTIDGNVTTIDDPSASSSVSLLYIAGSVSWKAGKGIFAFASGKNSKNPKTYSLTGNAGGRFYGIAVAINDNGTTMPISFYAYNIERAQSNPMSIIQNAKNVRIYYQKSEAGTNGTGLDTNTPIQILNSSNVRIYCVSGNVINTGARPMVDVVNSTDVLVSQAKSFNDVGTFPNIRETLGSMVFEIPTTYMSALYVRNPITDITSFSEFQPQVYPNPFTSNFSIDVSGGFDNIEIYNSLGQKIFKENTFETKQYDINFLAEKSSGIYFISIIGKATKKTFKIIKQ